MMIIQIFGILTYKLYQQMALLHIKYMIQPTMSPKNVVSIQLNSSTTFFFFFKSNHDQISVPFRS